MDEPTGNQKWGSVIVMILVTIVTAVFTLRNLPAVMAQASVTGRVDLAIALGGIFGTALAAGFLAWLIALAILIPLQKQWSVWGGGVFLPILIVAVFAIDSAAVFVPRVVYAASDRAAVDAAFTSTQMKLQANRTAFLTKLDEMEYPWFLHASSLGAPHGLEHAETKIKKARDVVEQAHARRDALIAELRSDIQKLAVSEQSKKSALTDIDALFDNADVRRSWEASQAALQEYQAMLDDIAEAKGGWRTDGDTLVFTRRSDLDTFKRHVQKAQADIAEAAAAEKRMIQTIRRASPSR